MPSPIIPGLPNLLDPSIFASNAGILSGDLIIGPQTNQPQWGIYLDGQPALVFDTFVAIDFRQGWAVSDYPVERGAFESYDKVSLPFDARVKFASGGSEENRQALLDAVAALSKTLLLYDVVTPEAVYQSVNVQHYDYKRTATNGVGLISVEIWFLEIRVTTDASYTTGSANATDGTATSSASATEFTTQGPPLTNTFDPSGMSSFNSGVVQTTPPTQADFTAFQLGGIH